MQRGGKTPKEELESFLEHLTGMKVKSFVNGYDGKDGLEQITFLSGTNPEMHHVDAATIQAVLSKVDGRVTTNVDSSPFTDGSTEIGAKFFRLQQSHILLRSLEKAYTNAYAEYQAKHEVTV